MKLIKRLLCKLGLHKYRVYDKGRCPEHIHLYERCVRCPKERVKYASLWTIKCWTKIPEIGDYDRIFRTVTE